MSLGMGHGRGPSRRYGLLKQPRGTRFRAMRTAESARQKLISADRKADRRLGDDDDGAPTSDPPEAHETENWADSDFVIANEEVQTGFEAEPRGGLPMLLDLPLACRPFVRFRITRRYKVQTLDPERNTWVEMQRVLALAIARHLSNEGCHFNQTGDWVEIPSIEGTKGLQQLLKASENDGKVPPACLQHLQFQLKENGEELKRFGILLPTGDVIAPAALLQPAGTKKSAMRGAAYRVSDSRPSELARQEWTAGDWRRLHTNTQKARSAKSKRRSEKPR